MKEKIKLIQEESDKIVNIENTRKELKLIVSDLTDFSKQVIDKLQQVDWSKKRDIIRTLVKRVEIGKEEVNIVFKINPANKGDSGQNLSSLQHCCRTREPFVF